MSAIVIITGSRNWTDRETIVRALGKFAPDSTLVIHGAARGADTVAAAVAAELGFAVRAFPADWKRHGRKAGPIRNGNMAGFAEVEANKDDAEIVVLAFPLPGSIGTWDMVRRADSIGWEVRLHEPAAATGDAP